MPSAVSSAAPIKIVNEEELRGHAKRGTAWPNNHHLRLQKESRQLGRDNATTRRFTMRSDEIKLALWFKCVNLASIKLCKLTCWKINPNHGNTMLKRKGGSGTIMAGNEASEKLSWPWRKRGRRKGEIRRKTITSHSERRPRHALVLSRVGRRQGEEGRDSGDSGREGGRGQCGTISVEEDRPYRPIVYNVGRKRGSRAEPGGAKREIPLITPKAPLFPPRQNELNLKFRATHAMLPVIPGDRS